MTQNKGVKFFSTLILFFVCLSAWGQEGISTEDLAIRKQYLEDRFVDYYTRLLVGERWNEKRLRAAQSMKQERQQREAERERARVQFVQQRRTQARAGEDKYLLELQQQREAHERARQNYVQRIQILRSLKKEFEVPPEQELGL